MLHCPHHIGVDEAGLGPNLGPLVIVATRWTGAVSTTDDLWNRFAEAVSQTRDSDRLHPHRLHIGDSKSVYRNKSDFPVLERSARAILAAAGITETGLQQLVATLDPAANLDGIPWLEGVEDGPDEAPDSLLLESLQKSGGQLQIAACFVPARRFNDELSKAASKGQALSRLSLQTLRRVWSPNDEPTSVWCDKHGGRNRYDDLLLEHCDGEFVIRHEEGRQASRYTVGQSQIVFGVKSERHFPVACASLIAKYLRQRAMRSFNAWWSERVPNLKPTEGYPQDAKRFRADIDNTMATLNLSAATLWRRK